MSKSMNKLILTTLTASLLTLTACSTTNANTQGNSSMTTPSMIQTLSQDQAKIALTLQSMGTLADRNMWDELGTIFTDEVVLDYTSAFGGEVSTVKRDDLMNQWAGLLPGFYNTYHDINNITVDVTGNTATATADVIASHYIANPNGDDFWQIAGTYDYKLSKVGNDWQISSLTLNAGEEKGTRDVLGLAMERAKQQ